MVNDKASVLRVETTINNPREFRIPRFVTNEATGRRERRWCPMRKGVGDLWRNFQVGIAANHRYLDALAAALAQRRRRRRTRCLVPANHQPRAPLRPVQPTQPDRPRPVPSSARR